VNAPTYENRFNLTTLVAAANLALLLVGGGSAYATVRAELKAAHETDLRVMSEIATIRAEAANREARVRALELGAGRTEEKLNNIIEGLARIERQLETRP
jgi:hypothetical protein